MRVRIRIERRSIAGRLLLAAHQPLQLSAPENALKTAALAVPHHPALIPLPEPVFAERQRRKKLSIWASAIMLALIAFLIHRTYTIPLRARESYDLGERLYRVARYTEAIVAFSAAIDDQPRFADAYLLRGRARTGMNDVPRAMGDFAKAIALQPRNAQAYIARGRAYLLLRHFGEALQDGEMALRIDSVSGEAFALKGSTLRALGQLTEAAQFFDAAVTRDPSIEHLFERGVTYQMLGRHEQAIADLARIIELYPYSAETFYSRAHSWSELGKETLARADRKQARTIEGE